MKRKTSKGYSAKRLSLCLRDASVTWPDKGYPALEKIYIENKANWSKDYTNSNKIICTIKTASLFEGNSVSCLDKYIGVIKKKP